jgi:uncharacterized membrane protein YdjX (TVP38/TMEM64 family)
VLLQFFAGWRDYLTTWPVGPVLYLLACFIRPITFIGAAPLALIGGHLYGPVAGPILAITGWILSTLPGYWFGRWLPATWQNWRHWPKKLHKAMVASHRYPWPSAFLLRLFIPWDSVNAVLGNLRIPWRVVMTTGAVSAFGQALAWSLAGASVTTNGAQSAQVNPTIMLIALLVSLGLTAISMVWPKIKKLLQPPLKKISHRKTVQRRTV